MNTLKELIQLKKENGQTIVLVAISLIVILALAALAIDVGIAYVIRTKLNSAVDGAAIAAGNAVKRGATVDERKSNARDAADRFLNANFPANYMNSPALFFNKNNTADFDAVFNADGTWTISVSARATAPTYFSRAVGWSNLTVHAEAETIVRDLDMILVLDTSGSLNTPSGTFRALKEAAINFIGTGPENGFDEWEGGDRIGLVTFASGAVVNVPINKTAARGFDNTAITNAINNLANPTTGATASAEGMRRAQVELDAIPQDIRSSLRVIVFFSDGAPNMVAARFNDIGVTGTLYSETSGSSCENRCGTIYRGTGGCPGNACASPACSGERRGFRLWYHDQRDNSLSGSYSCGDANAGYSYCCLINTLPTTGVGGVNLASDIGTRSITYTNTRCNVNKAARNMVENVANTARSGTGTNAISVYTLGLGDALNNLEITFCGYGNEERGANILKRLANTTDSDTYNSTQPSGIYAYAANASELDRAFQEIRNQILRLTK